MEAEKPNISFTETDRDRLIRQVMSTQEATALADSIEDDKDRIAALEHDLADLAVMLRRWTYAHRHKRNSLSDQTEALLRQGRFEHLFSPLREASGD